MNKNVLSLLIVVLISCNQKADNKWIYKLNKKINICFYKKATNKIYIKGVNNCEYLFFDSNIKKGKYLYSNNSTIFNNLNSECDKYSGFIIYVSNIIEDTFLIKHFATDSLYAPYEMIIEDKNFYNYNITDVYEFKIIYNDSTFIIKEYKYFPSNYYNVSFPYEWSDIKCGV